ncbi:hypothetical protein E4U19_007518 [Claviceps sp. Clav32 group G5]|nr:hypothetical protein E4U40_002392 [Claviceps sp. LM458 group G5]KAG6039020.1 hypothetical protein E4U19_007518 [Claviceps sp. Clav32 group G5]KAG6051562.1 hypothetical protein E4U39_000390 [Claviceps sp. Clav50 group G5]
MLSKLVVLVLATAAFAHTSTCPGSGRCCQCRAYGRYFNSQTSCVYNLVGAHDWGDDGDGLYFCRMSESQETIRRYCEGETDFCNDTHQPFKGSYECWDC